MHLSMKSALFTLAASVVVGGAATAATSLPAPGEWDGVTPSAVLETPYEDPAQSYVPFGMISYYMQPWRSYMDTWSAAHYEGSEGANLNIDTKYDDAVGQILQECGIRTVRIEIGWGNLDWNDQLPESFIKRMQPTFDMCRRYHIRPMILLNGHHGQPCPTRDVPVTLISDAKIGDTVLKLAPGASVHEGYTGARSANYIAAYPLITKVDPDGTAHLSAALDTNFKAGPLRLVELKYQPFQGDHLIDGTPVPACQQTYDGWIKYVAAVTEYVRNALGTEGLPDSGFDLEVWNEYSFGSNFLNIANYYDDKPRYKLYQKNWSHVYKDSRLLTPQLRPGSATDFEAGNVDALLPITVDYVVAHRSELPGVKVVNGMSNQRPWDNGSELWPGQSGFSRHYYTGAWYDIAPNSAPNINANGETGTIDALGHFDGKLIAPGSNAVVTGSVFIPSFRIGFPEYGHSGFKTESLSRDVLPDSRYVFFKGHGRYTNNGDFHPAEVWETETNYWRNPFFEQYIFKDGTVKRDDPAALALDEHLNAKFMLRQYIFHNHKGLSRIYIYGLKADPYSFGLLTPKFYQALDANNDVLTPAVRATLPEGFAGLAWLTKQMDNAEQIDAPRPLKVTRVVEYKPRLVFAGDGTPAHPNTWNRDWFTFLPYQLAPNRFLIPYYVQTTDQTHVWNKNKALTDPQRWDMPAQDYDVTIANIRGKDAAISVFDPLTMKSVPVTATDSTTKSLTVHLSAVDYPRFLMVTETQNGPQIIHPTVTLLASNEVRVDWKANMPAFASITYGAGWQNRSSQQADLKAGTYTYTIPSVIPGVVAVRIKLSANGLTDTWPHWDEDPQGQVVAPGDMETTDAATSVGQPTVNSQSPTVPITSLLSGSGPSLPQRYVDILSGWSLRIPANITANANGPTMEAALNAGSGVVVLRARYIPNGEANASDQIPIASTIDTETVTPVKLTAGELGTLYDFSLAPAAHPGISNLRQLYLIVPAGKNNQDIFVLSSSGTLQAMAAERATVLSIMASIKPANSPN